MRYNRLLSIPKGATEMGDRGNVRLTEGEGDVWLYTHWRGSDLPQIVQSALRRGKNRWGDPPYLNRIIFDELSAGDQGSETGFGISASIGDNSHAIVVVDHARMLVAFSGDGKFNEAVERAWPFAAYVELPAETLAEVFSAARSAP